MPRAVVDVWDLDPEWRPPPELTAQLELAHRVREELVTLHLRYEAELSAFWSSFPTVAAAERALAKAESAGDDTITGSANIAAARQARMDTIATLADETALKRAEWAMALKTHQKQLYGQYCQRNDLYWATFNDVFIRYRAAVTWIRQRRRAGACVTLKHRGFAGEGTVAVQLRHRTGWPAPIPAVVADATSKYGSVAVLPWEDPTGKVPSASADGQRNGCQFARLRCGQYNGLPAWVTLPVRRCHRLPAHAAIVNVSLTVRHTSGVLRGQLSVTAMVGDRGGVPDRPNTSAVALLASEAAWNPAEGGGQVAHWHSTEPLCIPSELRSSIILDSSTSGRIMLSDSMKEGRRRAGDIRAQRHSGLDVIRAQLVDWLREHGPIPHLGDGTEDDDTEGAGHQRACWSADAVNLWRTPRPFAALAESWRSVAPSCGDDIVRRLDRWQLADRRQWASEYSLRSQSVRSRDTVYQSIAEVLTRHATVIVVDRAVPPTAAVAATALVDGVEQERLFASPERLREITIGTATSNGCHLIDIGSAASSRTRTGHLCSLTCSNDHERLILRLLCPGCHHGRR